MPTISARDAFSQAAGEDVTPIFEAIAEIEEGRAATARDLAETAIAYADEHRIAEAPQLALAHSVVARTSNEATSNCMLSQDCATPGDTCVDGVCR